MPWLVVLLVVSVLLLLLVLVVKGAGKNEVCVYSIENSFIGWLVACVCMFVIE